MTGFLDLLLLVAFLGFFAVCAAIITVAIVRFRRHRAKQRALAPASNRK